MKTILNDEELNKVTGGNTQPKYINCPRCNETIYITMEMLIKSGSLYCPHCDLSIDIDPIR